MLAWYKHRTIDTAGWKKHLKIYIKKTKFQEALVFIEIAATQFRKSEHFRDICMKRGQNLLVSIQTSAKPQEFTELYLRHVKRQDTQCFFFNQSQGGRFISTESRVFVNTRPT